MYLSANVEVNWGGGLGSLSKVGPNFDVICKFSLNNSFNFDDRPKTFVVNL